MYKEFNILKHSLTHFYTMTLAVIGISIFEFYKEGMYFIQFTYKILLFFLIFEILICIYYFRDYKLIVDDEKIEFFYIYTKPKSMQWTNIGKIEVEQEIQIFRGQHTQLIHFYNNNCICSFNISNIDKEEFLKVLINLCSNYNIMIKYVS